jgi:hypothetical protein
MSAREDLVAQVQLRHAPSAGAAADICYTAEPRTGAAKVAPRPHERHALLEGLPLATPVVSQDNRSASVRTSTLPEALRVEAPRSLGTALSAPGSSQFEYHPGCEESVMTSASPASGVGVRSARNTFSRRASCPASRS